jgi:drug/metabolite transporter (DMT)-like permease
LEIAPATDTLRRGVLASCHPGAKRYDSWLMGTKPRTNPHDTSAPYRGVTTAGSRLALVALIAGAVGIACSPIFVRLSDLGPTATAFWRLALALAILWLWTEVGNRREAAPTRRPSGRRALLGLTLAGLYFTGDLALWHWSIGFTSVANSTLLVNLAPVFVALGGRLLFGEWFAYTFLVGMAVALAGAVLLVGGDLGLGLRQLFGDALALLAAVFYAGYILSISRLRSRSSTAAVMTYSGIVTCVALLPIALLSGGTFSPRPPTGSRCCSASPSSPRSEAIASAPTPSPTCRQPSPRWACSCSPSPPRCSPGRSWAILGEALGWWQALGGAVVLTGIVLARHPATSYLGLM